MKPGLQLKLGTGLTLTPQLRQAIRLLQLSSIELEAEISDALASNPLLEREESSSNSDTDDVAADAPTANEHDDSNIEPGDTPSSEFEAPEIEFADEADDWRSSSGPASNSDDSEMQQAATHDSLHQHLIWQLQLNHLAPRDVRIGEILIDSINDDGYYLGSFEDVRSALKDETIGDAEIETVLHVIQHFDPIGIGARNLNECLCIQLKTYSADTPALHEARIICEKYLDQIAKSSSRLWEKLHCAEQVYQDAVALIKTLEPKPGREFDQDATEYVQPDAIAFKQNNRWQVRLAPHAQPRLSLNRTYQKMIGSSKSEADHYLRGQLQEAKWLIKSLESRADTLLRVAQVIVKQQSGFLEVGPEAMRPLTLKQVAESIGMHESTVSRATSRKYLRTPRGTIEFKAFFSAGVENDVGGSTSSTAIQALIRRLIDNEDPQKPYSDARLTELLQNEGVKVARRTVAKYREGMNILPSHERQRL
jgi:RNA polymerase sigma-54 factor